MDCPLCGATLPEARPRYRVTLTVSDGTRSTGVTNDETNTETYVCEECWSDIKGNVQG